MNEKKNLITALKNIQSGNQDRVHIRDTLIPCLEKDSISVMPDEIQKYADKIERQLNNLKLTRNPPEYKPWSSEAVLQAFLEAYKVFGHYLEASEKMAISSCVFR